MSRGHRRGRGLLLAVVLLLSLAVLGPALTASTGSGQGAPADAAAAFAEARAEGRAHTVAPHPNSTMAIWPYTSRSKSVEGATLPINMVVLADVDLVRTMLIHRPDAEWEDQREGLNGSVSRANESVAEATPTETAARPTPTPTANASTGTSPNGSTAAPTAAGNGTTSAPDARVVQRAPTPNGSEGAPNASTPGPTATPNGTVGLADVTVAEPTIEPGAGAPTSTPNATTTADDGGEGPLFPTGINSTGVYWSEASGSDRYTYVRSGEPGSGRWIAEADQLHDGDYFGTRYHIRFYSVVDGENSWTALQVHREHFDWFRLRHTVGSLPRAQHYVETQFYDQWYIADLTRERFTRGGILGADGWVTVVDIKYPGVLRESLAAMAFVLGVALGGVFRDWSPSFGRRDVRTVRETVPVGTRFVVMALVIAAIPLFVRMGSLAVERAGIVNSPKVVAAVFYPVLALGLPVCAYLLARSLAPQEAFAGGVVGLGAGILADYAFLGISALPTAVIVHRAVLLLAIGLVAVAGTDPPEGSRVASRDPTLVAGGSLWVAGLLWTLFLW